VEVINSVFAGCQQGAYEAGVRLTMTRVGARSEPFRCFGDRGPLFVYGQPGGR
jgi:hypothetical protein